MPMQRILWRLRSEPRVRRPLFLLATSTMRLRRQTCSGSSRTVDTLRRSASQARSPRRPNVASASLYSTLLWLRDVHVDSIARTTTAEKSKLHLHLKIGGQRLTEEARVVERMVARVVARKVATVTAAKAAVVGRPQREAELFSRLKRVVDKRAHLGGVPLRDHQEDARRGEGRQQGVRDHAHAPGVVLSGVLPGARRRTLHPVSIEEMLVGRSTGRRGRVRRAVTVTSRLDPHGQDGHQRRKPGEGAEYVGGRAWSESAVWPPGTAGSAGFVLCQCTGGARCGCRLLLEFAGSPSRP
mmetsp:Transcript_33955/g.59991  ORF Transcript_33955/g.59991 Transcript_33955/m.59991 type:complete len:298 (-) Transcript_33955:12-905(-)